MQTIDLSVVSRRTLNQKLQSLNSETNETLWRVENPAGAHALAVGLNAPVTVEIAGHAGYYCAGMNQHANIVVKGNAGVGVAENMMSGVVRVTGDASQSAGATANGGLLIVEGNASGRCGISMKGANIVVGGSVGPMSAFMAQSGVLVVLGDAGADLGDSIYEARLYVRGRVESLGTDCVEKEMNEEHHAQLRLLLNAAGMETVSTDGFRRYGSARKLYNFHVDHVGDY